MSPVSILHVHWKHCLQWTGRLHVGLTFNQSQFIVLNVNDISGEGQTQSYMKAHGAPTQPTSLPKKCRTTFDVSCQKLFPGENL